MAFELKEASLKDVRIKMALAGKAGAGKTFGALLIAKGLVSDIKTIGVIQTEPGRAQVYRKHVQSFRVLDLSPPFTPERYIEAIEFCEQNGVKCLIIDSISDEWAGIGGALELQSAAADVVKNSFSAWKTVTPRHDKFFNKVLSSPIHIIATVRKKTDYIMETNERGKQVPKKVGLKDIQREDTDYKWMLQLELDQEGNLAKASKDNTELFQGKPPFVITEETGRVLRNWCLSLEGKGE